MPIERRVRARGLQGKTDAPVGRVPSPGAPGRGISGVVEKFEKSKNLAAAEVTRLSSKNRGQRTANRGQTYI